MTTKMIIFFSSIFIFLALVQHVQAFTTTVPLNEATTLAETYNVAVASNGHIDATTVTDVALTGTGATMGYAPTVDPATVPTQLLNIVGYWGFDSVATSPTTGLPTTPDTSLGSTQLGPQTATAEGAPTYLPAGGRYGGAFQFVTTPTTDEYLYVPNDPLPGDAPSTTGFSYALWLLPNASLANGRVLERQYDNYDVNYAETSVTCQLALVPTTGWAGYLSASWNIPHPPLQTWLHVACVFSGSVLSIYINGSHVANTTHPSAPPYTFEHGSNTPLGIGGRPFSGQHDGFTGVIDDVTIWNKPLSAAEVAAVASSPVAIAPFRGVGFLSQKFVNISLFTQLQVAVTPTSIASSIVVKFSTDSGLNWCTISPGEQISMLSQGNNPICLFPAVSLLYQVSFLAAVTLQGVVFTFGQAPDDWTGLIFPVGLNIASPNYYATEWHFVDVMRNIGNSGYPTTLAYNPVTGLPLNVTTATTPAVTALAMTNNPFGYPAGTWTVYANGTGNLALHFDPGNHYFSAPCVYPFNITNPVTGFELQIISSSASDPINSISIVMPGFNANYTTDPFHPAFLQSISGFSPTRFMDWGNTNNMGMSSWSTRATPNTALENGMAVNTFNIVSILRDPSPAGCTGLFFQGQQCAIVTIDIHSSPTGFNVSLVTGQLVAISGTDSYANYTDNTGAPGTQSLNLATWQGIIETVSPSSFRVAFSQYFWTSAYNVTFFQPGGAQGTVTWEVGRGVAYETMMQLANANGGDAWVNIPTLADDEYVANVAQIIKDNLRAPLKAYIEYSNEVWNYGFSANGYAYKMSLKLGLQGGAAAYTTYRSLQIFKIFQDVFGSPEAMSAKIIKVIPSQAANSGLSQYLLQQTLNATINPYNISVDALAIAPYFGDAVASYIMANNLLATISIDDALDLARAAVESETRMFTRTSYAVAKKFNVKLVAYESGQSLVSDVADQNNNALTALLENMNRHPRMQGIYDNMLRAWAQEGGDVMNAFSSTGEYSKYGSWGFKEYQLQPDQTAPKYLSLRAAVTRYQNSLINNPTPSPTQKPKGKPSSPTKSNSTPIIAGVVGGIGAAAIIVGVAFLLLRKKNGHESEMKAI